MATIDAVVLDVPDPDAAEAFYAAAFGLDDRVRVRAGEPPTSGFRGYTLSLVVSRPSTVDSFVGTAVDAGATTLKPPEKSLWGYGAVVQAPDGAIWQVATSSKKDTGPTTREVDSVVLLLGAGDVKASKRFYSDRGLTVGKSFGKYVEFTLPGSRIDLALYSRKAAAKAAGVDPEGYGSHRLTVVGDLGEFTDPDGLAWETSSGDGHAPT